MVIKVISDNVIHNGESVGVGGVIKNIDNENAKRLCKDGLCEVLPDVEIEGDVSEAELHEKEINLEKMTKSELIEYAKGIGVEVDGKDTKVTIIEKMTQADMPKTDIPTE